MKKVSLIMLILIANISFISCTEENLAEVMATPDEQYASDGENGNNDPEEEKP